MRWYLCLLMLLCLLTACGESTQLVTLGDPSAASVTPAVPTLRPTLTPGLAVDLNPTPIPSPEIDPTPHTLPPDVQLATWNRLRFRYNAEAFALIETSPQGQRASAALVARATARLVHTPDLCLNVYIGSDCFNQEIGFALYPSEGLDLATWLARTDPALIWWPGPELSFSAVVAGQPALGWAGDGIRQSETSYAVALGDDILVVGGSVDDSFLADLQFITPGADLSVGDSAMTSQSTTLWTTPTDGEQVEERPALYAGAVVTILALQDDAAQVLTIDHVAGWVRGVSAVLTSDIRMTETQSRLIGPQPVRAEVMYSSAIPLRDRPRSTGLPLGAPVEPGQQLAVIGVCGDWLQVYVENPAGTGQVGWMRWFYDGTQYIDLVQPCSFDRRMPNVTIPAERHQRVL